MYHVDGEKQQLRTLLPNVSIFFTGMIEKMQLLDSLKSFEVSPGTKSEDPGSRTHEQIPTLQNPEDIDTLNRKNCELRSNL